MRAHPASLQAAGLRLPRANQAMAELARRSPTMVAGGAFVVTVALAAANGGYSPSAWNWTTLLLVWVLAVALVLRERIALSRFEMATLACLAAFVLLTGLSIAWSHDSPQSILELQRGFLYLIGLATVLASVRMRSIPHLLGGLLAGIAVVATYSLLARPFPAGGEELDPIFSSRLSDPIGYWNALGAFAGMGVLLALGFAAHGRGIVSRAASATTLPILLTTLYLTFSRGAWIALAIGLVAAITLGSKRLSLITALLALAPASIAAVLISSQSDALTTPGASQQAIAAAGRDLAPTILLLVAVSMGAAVALTLADRRFEFSAAARRGYAVGLAIVALACLAVVFTRLGGPLELAEKAYVSFAGNAGREARLGKQPQPTPLHASEPWARGGVGSGFGPAEGESLVWVRSGQLRAVLAAHAAGTHTVPRRAQPLSRDARGARLDRGGLDTRNASPPDRRCHLGTPTGARCRRVRRVRDIHGPRGRRLGLGASRGRSGGFGHWRVTPPARLAPGPP